MKTIFAFLMIILSLKLSGQSFRDERIFKTTYFNVNNWVVKTKIDTLKWDKKLDLSFYKKYFNKPDNFPAEFINTKFRDDTLTVWNDSTKEMSFISNWTYTYVFDSLSRVSRYIFSTCIECKVYPFNYIIFYDEHNRPVRMENRQSIRLKNERLEIDKNAPPDQEFIFSYDEFGNIVQVKCNIDGHKDMIIEIVGSE